MKKLLIGALVFASLSLVSCSSLKKTAASVPVQTGIESVAKADLKVSPEKISYTFIPESSHNRCGEKAVIETAVAEALKNAGKNADVLINPQYEIKKSGKKIKYVVVTGYPAFYTNIRTH